MPPRSKTPAEVPADDVAPVPSGFVFEEATEDEAPKITRERGHGGAFDEILTITYDQDFTSAKKFAKTSVDNVKRTLTQLRNAAAYLGYGITLRAEYGSVDSDGNAIETGPGVVYFRAKDKRVVEKRPEGWSDERWSAYQKEKKRLGILAKKGTPA